MKSYWCIGNDAAGRDFSVMIEAVDDHAMWKELDRRFGGPVPRDGLKIAEMSFSPYFRVSRPVFGLEEKEVTP